MLHGHDDRLAAVCPELGEIESLNALCSAESAEGCLPGCKVIADAPQGGLSALGGAERSAVAGTRLEEDGQG